MAATGTGPLGFQWYRGESGQIDAPVDGARAAAFTTPLTRDEALAKQAEAAGIKPGSLPGLGGSGGLRLPGLGGGLPGLPGLPKKK